MQAGFIDAIRAAAVCSRRTHETLDALVPHALALGSGAALAEIGSSLDAVRTTAAGCDAFRRTKS
jgi:hypothetical protein